LESSSPNDKNGENKQSRNPSDSPPKNTRQAPGRAAEEVISLRMIYEDDLRKACGKRALEIKDQSLWMAFRKRIPISQWVERKFESKQSKSENKQLLKELEKYHRIFSEEAEERSLALDMERNYYSEAVELLAKSRYPDKLKEKDRNCLTKLMIMVDFKDARLGIQILKSIL